MGLALQHERRCSECFCISLLHSYPALRADTLPYMPAAISTPVLPAGLPTSMLVSIPETIDSTPLEPNDRCMRVLLHPSQHHPTLITPFITLSTKIPTRFLNHMRCGKQIARHTRGFQIYPSVVRYSRWGTRYFAHDLAESSRSLVLSNFAYVSSSLSSPHSNS